jgi:hypothetical protein
MDRTAEIVNRRPERRRSVGNLAAGPVHEASRDAAGERAGHALITKFDLPSGTPARRGQKFRYVFHSHVLEHDDGDTLRPNDVVG